MSYVLGLDGGNTKTVALVVRGDGTIVGFGRAGCADIRHAASIEDALDAVTSAAHTALGAASLRIADLDATTFSVAGVDWPEDVVFLEEQLAPRGFNRGVLVVNDAFGALRAGSPDGTGVVIACGTGTAIGARAATGRAWYAGYWLVGYGGQALGEEAVRAACRAALGIAPPTTLLARVTAYFGQSSMEGLLRLLTARERPAPPNLAPLAPIVLDAAAEGDETARRIVAGHGTDLGDCALAAARQVGLGDSPYTLVLAGGVVRHPSRLLAGTIIARVHAQAPRARPLVSQFEPVVGAALLALEASGVSIGEAVEARLRASMPPPALFTTYPESGGS